MRKRLVFFSVILIFMLTACSSTPDSAAKPVESFLQSIVDQDTDRLATLVCKDWQDHALLELDAFMGVDAELENVSCIEKEAAADIALVECSGNILATYNNEQQKFSLDGRIYKVLKEGGDWLVCGYP